MAAVGERTRGKKKERKMSAVLEGNRSPGYSPTRASSYPATHLDFPPAFSSCSLPPSLTPPPPPPPLSHLTHLFPFDCLATSNQVADPLPAPPRPSIFLPLTTSRDPTRRLITSCCPQPSRRPCWARPTSSFFLFFWNVGGIQLWRGGGRRRREQGSSGARWFGGRVAQ